MLSQRMLDGQIKPTATEMAKTVGEKSLHWAELQNYLADNYNFVPETVFYGRKYGWTIRYRKSGKTLCSLFPEVNGLRF